MLSIQELVTLVRSSVNVQIPGSENTDPAYLTMSDEDIMLFIKLGITRAFPDCESVEDLPEGSEYPLVLLAKIELYAKLAVTKANAVDMGADNNNYLKQSQRFSHYMSLVEKTKDLYNEWLENESIGANTVSSHDVLLSNRHYTRRNYEKQAMPKVRLYLDQVTNEDVKYHWKVSQSSHFGRFKVYIDTKPVFNPYASGSYDKHISDTAKLIKSTGDIRDCYHELAGLKPDTTYYLAVFSIERNQVFGCKEVSFTTLKELVAEENVSAETL